MSPPGRRDAPCTNRTAAGPLTGRRPAGPMATSARRPAGPHQAQSPVPWPAGAKRSAPASGWAGIGEAPWRAARQTGRSGPAQPRLVPRVRPQRLWGLQPWPGGAQPWPAPDGPASALPSDEPLRFREHPGHHGAGILRLPGAIGLSSRQWPRDVQVDAGPEGRCLREHRQGRLKYTSLSPPVPGQAEGVTERELDSDDARGQLRLRDPRHHRHDDGRDASALDSSCQHGHVSAALRSSGR